MSTELVKGKSIEEALKLTNQAVAEALDGLPPQKLHCSVLAEEGIRACLADYYKRQGLPIPFDYKEPDGEDENHVHVIED
jgi:nitrogen fixation NifU-like protein